MIGFLKGEVDFIATDYCLLDCNGVGYRVFVPESTRSRLIAGETARLMISTQVREDAILLYGFLSREEYELYLLLLNVNGVGSKLALAILSASGAADFRRAIAAQDVGILTRIPGIGKKTAERMIVELKDKVGTISESSAGLNVVAQATAGVSGNEALQALIALGYSRSEVSAVLKKVDCAQPVADIVKQALKEFMKQV